MVYDTPEQRAEFVELPSLQRVAPWHGGHPPGFMALPTEKCSIRGVFIACLTLLDPADDELGWYAGNLTKTHPQGGWFSSSVTDSVWKNITVSASGLLAVQLSSDETPHIYAVNLETADDGFQMRQVSMLLPADVNEYPATYGNDVVWRYCDQHGCGLRRNQLPVDQVATEVPLDGGIAPSAPDIDDRRIVFAADFGTERDIVVYDYGTGTTRRLERTGPQDRPRISGQRVAFESNGHVEVWDLNNDDVWTVPGYGTSQSDPAIDATRIVFLDKRRGFENVTAFDFTPRNGGATPDDDGDGVASTTDECPCSKDESDPWTEADQDGVCVACDQLLSYYCMGYCQTAVLDSCPGVTNTGTNCNLHAERALGAPILDDACDPVFCAEPTPIFETQCSEPASVGGGAVMIQTCDAWVDHLDFRKVSHDEDMASFVDYRACVDSLLDPLRRCSDPDFVDDDLRVKRTTVSDEQDGDPWRRVLTEATANDLDAEDRAEDALDFVKWDGLRDLERKWSQVDDFMRWSIEPEKALFWTHVEANWGLTVRSNKTQPTIHWPGRDLGNSYVEIPPPATKYLFYPGRPPVSGRYRPILIEECHTCPLVQLYRGEDRIRWETDILIGLGEETGVYGWLL